MFGLSSKKPPDRSLLLAAILTRNKLVQESKRTAESLRLTAPLRENLLKRFFNSRASEKHFEIDALGIDIWDRIDDRRSIQMIIEAFARQHRLNLREAEVSVLAFLKILTQRNLIAIIAPPDKNEPKPPKLRKKKHKK